jgi:hypothetical protein
MSSRSKGAQSAFLLSIGCTHMHITGNDKFPSEPYSEQALILLVTTQKDFYTFQIARRGPVLKDGESLLDPQSMRDITVILNTVMLIPASDK